MDRRRFLAGAAALMLSAACAPKRTDSIFPKAPASYAFALSGLFGLLALDAAGQVLGEIAPLPANSSVASGLTLSSDRRRLVFTSFLQDTERGNGSDIFEVNVDGSGMRTLVRHEAANVYYAAPQLDPTGRLLYAHRRTALTQGGTVTGSRDELVVVELATQQRRTVLEGGVEPRVSPDGKVLVYVHLKDGRPDALWRMDGSVRPLNASAWDYVQAPRFSPDGAQIAFFSAGQRSRGGSGGSSGGKLAHLGIPGTLVLVAVDGSSQRGLMSAPDDLIPSWSPDGSAIAFISGGALQILDVRSGSSRELAKGEEYVNAEVVWIA